MKSKNNGLFPEISECLKSGKFLAYAFFALVLLAAVLIVFSFSTGLNNYDVYDYVEGVFWAEATVRSRALVAPDYIYYYLVPFGSNLIMAPFVLLFGSTLLANQLGMLVWFILCLAVLYRLARVLYQKMWTRLVFCAVVLLFVFTYAGDNLLHHLLVYGIGFVCLLGELSCLIEIGRRHRIAWNLVLLALFCLWSAGNGMASAALSSLSVILAALFLAVRSASLREKHRIASLLVLVLATALGLLVYKYLDAKALSLDKYQTRFRLADADAAVTNLIHDLWTDYLTIFEYDPNGASLFSLRGISSLVKLFFALLIPAVPFLVKRLSRGQEAPVEEPGKASEESREESRLLIVCSGLLVLAVCVGQYVFTDLSVQRYLMNGILSLFLIAGLRFTDYLEKGGKKILLLGFFLLAVLLSVKEFHALPSQEAKKQEFAEIQTILEDRGLTKGYSLKRDFKVVELLSGGRIHDTVIHYVQEDDQFEVVRDRIYPYETEKPEDADRFFVIRLTVQDTKIDRLLESTCQEAVSAKRGTVYVFGIEDWGRLFGEE